MLRTPDGICPVSAASREVAASSVLAAFATQQLLADCVQETVLRRLMKRRVFGIDARANKFGTCCHLSGCLSSQHLPCCVKKALLIG